MRSRFALATLTVVLAVPVHSQEVIVDTTSAWRYVPLHVGDAWEYSVLRGEIAGGQPFTVTRLVLKDTLIDGAVHDVILEKEYQDGPPLPDPAVRQFTARFDTLNSRLEWYGRLVGSAPCPLDVPFPAPPGDVVRTECGGGIASNVWGGYEQAVKVGSQTYTLAVKGMGDATVVGEESTFAADIGMVGGGIMESPGEEWALRTARVQGQFYGEPPGERFPALPASAEPWRYYPLEQGNEWQFTVLVSPDSEAAVRHRVIGDTLVGGIQHALLTLDRFRTDGTRSFSRRLAVRYDTMAAQVVGDTGFLGIPFCTLGLTGSGIPCQMECEAVASVSTQEVEIGTDVVETEVFEYDAGGCERVEAFADGIGPVAFGTLGYAAELTFARVGGQEFGSRIVVSTEERPEAGALTLTASPNPATSRLGLTMGHPGAGVLLLEAFDALGRRVLSREVAEARVTLDVSGWAPGAYTIRVSGAGETAVRRVVVR